MENIEKCLICLFDLVSSYLMKTNSTSWQHYVIQPHYFTPLFMQILLIRVCVYSIHLILENFLRILWVLAPFFSFVFGLFCFCFFLFWFVLFCFVLVIFCLFCFGFCFVLVFIFYFGLRRRRDSWIICGPLSRVWFFSLLLLPLLLPLLPPFLFLLKLIYFCFYS